jgi:Flp pilus assembly protein TadD
MNTMSTAPSRLDRLDRLWQFHEADPGNVSLLRDIAGEGMRSGQFEQALKALDLIAASPEPCANDEAAAIHALLKLSRFADATDRADEAVARWPNEDEIRVEAARAWLNGGRTLNVIQVIQAAPFEQEPLDRMAGELLLQALWREGKLEEGIAQGTQWLSRYPEDPRLLALQSALLYDSTRGPEAFQLAHQAYAIAPQHAYIALHILASERLLQQDPAGAQRYIDQALKTNQRDGRIWLLQGSVEMISGHAERALTSLHKAIDLFPSHPGSYLTLAWLHISKRELELAEATVARAIEASPAFAESHGTMALIHVLNDRPEEARKSIRRALLLDKESFAARYAQRVLDEGIQPKIDDLLTELAVRVRM